MFRLYKLYTLYMNKMTSYGAERSPYWCLCQKLPRSILHIEPTPEMRCDVCGRLRRPSLSSSSDEEEIAAERSQKTLAQQQCSELYKERQKLEEQQQQLDAQQSSTGAGPVRVNVSQNAQKPKSKRRAANCNKCGNKIKSVTHPKSLPTGRFGHCRKPYRLVTCKHKCPELEPTAPSPPRSQSTTPPPQATASLAQSPEDCNDEDIPNLVAFAHEVFNRPLHLRQRQTSFYDNLFVSDFIPLDTPITDGSGGAISKRRRLFGRPLRTHCSRPLPPLSQVLALIKEKQQVRAKGGGLAPKQPDESVSNACSQFAPFDQYDGPSEDALVVEEARQTLRQPHALHIKHRPDLPSTRLPSFESEPGSDCSSLSACDAHAAAAPADRKHTVGAPAHLHEMMKAVTQSGLSDSIASSSNSTTSSTTSSSHKSASSTLPLRSRGGEEIAFTEDEHELEEIEATTVEPSSVYPNMPISIMEKIFWLVDQKQQQLPIMENKSLLQFIQELSVPDDEAQTALIHEVEQQLAAGEAQTNDMSNELPLNSTNKTADHEKYDKVLSHDSSAFTSSVTQMWSTISSLFVPSGCEEEKLPLKSDKPLGDGSSEKRKCKSNTNGKYTAQVTATKSTTKQANSCNITSTKHTCSKQEWHMNRIHAVKRARNKMLSNSMNLNLKQPCSKTMSDSSRTESTEVNAIPSTASSTNYESCLGSQLPQAKAEICNKVKQQLQNPMRFLATQKCVAEKIHTLYFVSHELTMPKTVSFAREMCCSRATGQLREFFAEPFNPQFYEFRTPDIETTQQCSMSESIDWQAEQQVEVKHYRSTVWPAHPYRHKQRRHRNSHIALMADESKCVNKSRQHKQTDLWIVNEAVKRQLHEMMQKPIKLLSAEVTAVNS